MAWFPEHRLLYGSDLVQPLLDGGFHAPQYLSELADAAAREGLAVERVFAMHSGVVDWASIEQALAQTRATSSAP